MAVQVRISYFLSQRGRRDSLRKGGDGRRLQQVVGTVGDADLDLFAVDDDGKVRLDATCFVPRDFPVPDSARWVRKSLSGPTDLEWDAVPAWADLIAVARAWRQAFEKLTTFLEAEKQQRDSIAQKFFADPTARAERIDRDGVRIAGCEFINDHPAAAEARRRRALDEEELQKAKQASLADWIARHGTDNQRQRLIAGVLPWKEATEAAEDALYRPLAGFPPYRRFDVEELCDCVKRGAQQPCSIKFQSVDATELTAEEWDQFAKIQAAVPGAGFQLREHRAQCRSASAPQVRRGVIVKLTLGQFAFKREFALYGSELP